MVLSSHARKAWKVLAVVLPLMAVAVTLGILVSPWLFLFIVVLPVEALLMPFFWRKKKPATEGETE